MIMYYFLKNNFKLKANKFKEDDYELKKILFNLRETKGFFLK
jgi:hypothetical protein